MSEGNAYIYKAKKKVRAHANSYIWTQVEKGKPHMKKKPSKNGSAHITALFVQKTRRNGIHLYRFFISLKRAISGQQSDQQKAKKQHQTKALFSV